MADQPAALLPAPLPPPGDPLDDPDIRRQVEAAKNVTYHMLRGLKMIALYRHNESKFSDFLRKAVDALQAYSLKYGTLQLKVEIANFTLHQQDLFSDETRIPYRFFKDGIRQIIFRPGFTLEEMTAFALIAVSDPDRGAEELNSQLWRAQLPNFEYLMVDGFKMDEFSGEEVQVEVDRIIDFLQRRLRTSTEDALRFARLTEDDLEMNLEDIDQIRGLVVTGKTASSELKARLQKDIHEEEHQRLFPKLISAVFQVVESGVDDAELLSDMFTQLLDAMLLQEDFALVHQVVQKLKAMEQRSGPESAVARLLKSFVEHMSEEQRISRVGDVLRFTRPKSPPEVLRYLSHLGHSSIPMLLDVLEQIELPENRVLLCDALIPMAKEHPKPFVERLNASPRPQLERDLVYILDRSNHPEKIRFFNAVLKSPNLAVKLEVMAIIARGRSADARSMIASLLNDPNMHVRTQAARVLPHFDRERAFAELTAIVGEPQFEERKAEEREAFYLAIASTDVPQTVGYFTGLLKAKAGFFSKQKLSAEKLHLISGLAAAATARAAQVLKDIAEDSSQPTEVSSAARVQLVKVRALLTAAQGRE